MEYQLVSEHTGGGYTITIPVNGDELFCPICGGSDVVVCQWDSTDIPEVNAQHIARSIRFYLDDDCTNAKRVGEILRPFRYGNFVDLLDLIIDRYSRLMATQYYKELARFTMHDNPSEDFKAWKLPYNLEVGEPDEVLTMPRFDDGEPLSFSKTDQKIDKGNGHFACMNNIVFFRGGKIVINASIAGCDDGIELSQGQTVKRYVEGE